MADEDAKTIIKNKLDQYKLGDLAGLVWDLYGKEVLNERSGIDDYGDALKDTEQFKKRFPANAVRISKGLPELSITDYIGMEKGYEDVMRGSGLPPGFYDSPDDFSAFIGNNTSAKEVSDRVYKGYDLVKKANPEVVKQMKELYGVNEGDLAAYFLDPEKGTDILKTRALTATISAEGKRQANIQLSATEAEALAAEGITTEAAQTGFAKIGSTQELLGTTLQGEQAITQAEQIGGTLGTNEAAKQRIESRKRQRQAGFTGGGGFATTQTGVSGLGSQ